MDKVFRNWILHHFLKSFYNDNIFQHFCTYAEKFTYLKILPSQANVYSCPSGTYSRTTKYLDY